MRSRAVLITAWDLYQLDPASWHNEQFSCTFAAWQMELAPETNRLHWQIYAEFDERVPFKVLHTWPGLDDPPAHFEPRRGSQRQAIEYCTKEDTRVDGPYFWGTKKEQGQRSDLDDMRRDLDRGDSLALVARNHFPVWVKYPSAVKSYQALQAADREGLPTVYIILGTTGTGKSRLARSMFPGAYWKPNFDFWENYQYEDVVVLDEFYGHKMQYTDLLQLLDSTPLLVNVKGASAKMNSNTFVFTSNQHPRYWYKQETLEKHCPFGDYDQSPLKRRLDEFATFIWLTNVNNMGPHPPPEPVLEIVPNRLWPGVLAVATSRGLVNFAN